MFIGVILKKMSGVTDAIKKAVNEFKCVLGGDENPSVRIITHYDTDGITSGAIIARALQRADCIFHLSIVKQLEKKVIDGLISEFSGVNNGILLFLDLSGDFSLVKNINAKIFFLDHHEIDKSIDFGDMNVVNPFLGETEKDEISGSGLAYLFAKELNAQNRDLSSLAIIGMVGDVLGNDLSKINNTILQDSDVEVRKGLSIFSSTKPLNKALEFSSDLFIPGVTGDSEGSIQFLRETGINFDGSKNILNLTQEELSKLVTAIILRKMNHNARLNNADNGNIGDSAESILGNIYTLKFFSRTEDVRELSTLINSCGRFGYGDVALAYCLGSLKAKNVVEEVYNNRKKKIIEGLNYIRNLKGEANGKNYSIYNCKNMIDDSIIGTLISILAFSFLHPAGNVLIGMAYRDDGKIKVSARISKSLEKNFKPTLNLKDMIASVCKNSGIDGESGGHANAAGCLVPASHEETFINALELELQERLK